jgi:glycosyltransferase involved in cell wall biosynthesis
MRVLVLGRLDPHQKGLDLLLDYAQRTPSLAKNFLVRLVGEGPYAEVVAAARRRDATLASFVTVEPWANDTTEVLSAHDALFITSRYEGVPLVMLEAMAMGIPVVASDLDGTRAYLTDECLFPVGRIDKGFERLSALRESEELRLSVALRNAEVFRRRASSGVFASAVEVLTLRFGDLVRSKSRASPVPPAPVEQPSARS